MGVTGELVESTLVEGLDFPPANLRRLRGGVGSEAIEAERFKGLGMGGNATGEESSIF